MRSGFLRHYITLQMPIHATNARGEKTKSWVTYRSAWAGIQPTSGRDFLDVHQTESETTATITMRYIAGVKAHMRIKHWNQYYEIVHIINPEERNEQLQILVRGPESG